MFIFRRHPKRVVLEDYCLGYTRKKSRRWRYYSLTLLLLIIGLLAWRSAQAMPAPVGSQPGSILSLENEDVSLAEVKAGQLLLSGDGAGYRRSVMLQGAVHFQISGMIAQVKLSQRFRNDSTAWVEGVYVFPLPEQAAVNRLRMRVGERRIEGEIKEKKQAKQLYQAAKNAGKKTGLVEQQRPNIFTTRVANIAPGETVEIELEYSQKVAYDQGQFSLRFPMTITPRYIPGKPLIPRREEPGLYQTAAQSLLTGAMGWAFNTDQVADADQISPWLSPEVSSVKAPINPMAITAELDMGMPLRNIDSAYHNIVLSRQGNRYKLRLSAAKVAMEQDFVLSWRPVTGAEPEAALFAEILPVELAADEFAATPDPSEAYILMMLLPPVMQSQAEGLAKEVIYIIDTSGSMDGVSIRQAKQSLLLAMDHLRPQDRFNIIEFNSKTFPLFDQAVIADRRHLQQARDYIRNIQSGGGTEMLAALQAAFTEPQQSASAIRQIIFITDGAVGNEEALFKEIQQHLGNSRLFTVGIGSAPNSYFMRKAAQFGRGTFTHIGDINEVQPVMSALFAKLDRPVMSNITLTWSDGIDAELYPMKIPDLYQGEPLLVSAKLSALSGSVLVEGDVAGQHWSRNLSLTTKHQQRGVAMLWAREKISTLLDEKIAGRDEAQVRTDVLAVALQHQLVSPYTSFVAIEQLISREEGEPLALLPVVNASPKGQGAQSFAYPNTASRGMQSIVLSMVILLLAYLSRLLLQRRS